MADAREYVAMVDFSLNFDNGKNSVNVKAGDAVVFDGLYAECRGEKGQARILTKVIGEWIQPVDGEVIPAPAPVSSSNMTGGRMIENSSPDQDPNTIAMQRRMSEGIPAEPARPVTAGRVVENSSPDQDPSVRVQQQGPKKAQVINQDDTEVAKVSVPAQTSNNVTGVRVEEQGMYKRATVSEEERTVKKTAYVKTKDDGDTYKHLKVDKEASGVEVRKVKAPAITRGEARSSTATHMEVSNEERVAKETTYDRPKATTVGSSTQASVEMTKIAGAPKREVISDSPQDARVVAKVSRVKEADVSEADGFTAKLTVGSSTVDDIEMSEVTFSGANESITDLSGPQDDGDVNVDDILKEL